MSMKSRKSPSNNRKNAEDSNKPLVRKVASKKAQGKKEKIGGAIKASQRKGKRAMKPGKDNPNETDPKLQKFEELGARIAKRAYELYEGRGGNHGHDVDDWIEAERQVLMEEKNSES